MTPDPDQLRDFARRYTEAWCSQDPARLADKEWTIGDDGLIAESKGHFDQAQYEHQLERGV